MGSVMILKKPLTMADSKHLKWTLADCTRSRWGLGLFLNICCLALLTFTACTGIGEMQEDPQKEIIQKIKGSWILQSVEMYNPDLGPGNEEDVSEVMVGANPSVLIFDKFDYLIAPGSSRHYLPLVGNWEIKIQGQSGSLSFVSPGNEFVSKFELSEDNRLSQSLRYEISRQPTECMKSNGLGGTIYIYQYTKLPE